MSNIRTGINMNFLGEYILHSHSFMQCWIGKGGRKKVHVVLKSHVSLGPEVFTKSKGENSVFISESKFGENCVKVMLPFLFWWKIWHVRWPKLEVTEFGENLKFWFFEKVKVRFSLLIPLNEFCDTFSVILSLDKSKNSHHCHCQQGSRWNPRGTFLSNVRILVSDYDLGMVWHMVAEASKHIEVS